MKRFVISLVALLSFVFSLRAADQFISFQSLPGSIDMQAGSIHVDDNDYAGVKRAVASLRADMMAACGREMQVTVGSLDKSKTIQQFAKSKLFDVKELKGKTEKFIISIAADGQVVIAGSDKRGTIYGIYELSRQLGVSPWNWWADMPVTQHDHIFLTPGQYTDGEPVVRYRGIFLNDEAPCLSNWVKEKFPDSECPTANPALAHGFNSHFYEKVFELLQRLKANYLWPAMWSNAFYVDDPQNGILADEMGIMMGTSHHEPMARNHQEWARHRKENGPWDYAVNQEVIDNFFREGVRRAKNNEDIITIGMRGDGDAAMGGKEGHDDEFVPDDNYYIQLYEKIFKNQRQIIKQETGKPAEKRPQIWALYKEVQRYYDLGLTVPDDVTILLCDDNWGNIRRVPTKPQKGGYGMYYHVDYVGAPRSTKWTNVTPAAHIWEQMMLCYQYGIDRLWILNVGDLKPMEYPIQLFLDMAWNPERFSDPKSIMQHTEEFCRGIFTDAQKNEAAEAARLMTKYGVFNGRVTPEMLTARTYNLATGEWQKVVNDYKALESDALRQWMTLPEASKSAYYQLVLFPIQCMANLYEMYYAQAIGDQAGIDKFFARDAALCDEYHHINGGKWNHLMREPHIGYTSWSGPKQNIKPVVADGKKTPRAVPSKKQDMFGYLSLEAEQYTDSKAADGAQWLTIPNYGRTQSGVAYWPYTASTEGASISYTFQTPAALTHILPQAMPYLQSAKLGSLKVHVVTNSTLPFLRREGHRYTVSLDGGTPVEVNYNSDLTEDNQWHMYDIVATRVIEKVVELTTFDPTKSTHTITICPLDPGLVLENVVIDFGGYQSQHLFGSKK